MDPVIARIKRAVNEARATHSRGMSAGFPEVKLDCNDVDRLLLVIEDQQRQIEEDNERWRKLMPVSTEGE